MVLFQYKWVVGRGEFVGGRSEFVGGVVNSSAVVLSCFGGEVLIVVVIVILIVMVWFRSCFVSY